jgi:hypothetical protein
LPEPLAPAVIVIQFCEGVALQVQPAPAVTAIEAAAPPPAATDCEGGAIVLVHEPA